MDVYVEDEEISLDLYQDEIERLQELTQEIIYDEADCRRALHKLLGMPEDDENEVIIDTDKSLAEQDLPCCWSCISLENNFCKEHFEEIKEPMHTICTEYEKSH